MNIKDRLKQWSRSLRMRLSRLSFRTGVVVLAMCIPCYILSLAQMALPISPSAKGVLWAIFFGLAKTAQYGGLTILGTEGLRRLRERFKKKPPTAGQ